MEDNYEYADLTRKIIGAAIEVHRNIGPGLMESVYEECLMRELATNDIAFRRQVSFPIEYKGVKLKTNLRIDFIVEEKVILEIKAIEKILPIHKAQILSYMKLAKKNIGLLINFNSPELIDGLERFVL